MYMEKNFHLRKNILVGMDELALEGRIVDLVRSLVEQNNGFFFCA